MSKKTPTGKKEHRGLISWLRNVFLYHYLWPTMIGLVVIGVVFIAVRDSFSVKKPDFTLVVGSIDIWREQDMSEILQLVRDEVGDANGDGEVNINLEIYTATIDKADEYGQQNLQALDMAFVGDPEKVLYIFDEELLLRYEPEYFESLADYGFESAKDPFYPLNDLPVFQRMLVVDTPYFMALKGWKLSEKDNENYIHTYELAVRVMERLIKAE
jgi:hypothetical protein